MWVRIDEVTFEPERSGAVINRTRNTAVGRHRGEGFRGFRLLVDHANNRALDVSYWDSEADARADSVEVQTPSDGPGATSVVRTNIYELAIDAC